MPALRRALEQPVSIAPLVLLRLLFGGIMSVGAIRFMARGWIHEFYVAPPYHFTYWGFGWVRPLPEAGLWLVFGALALLGLFIALGLFYRPSTAAFGLLFTYIELLDKSYYLNHYYFVSLFTFLLFFLPLNGAFSLDVRWGRVVGRTAVPAWQLWAVWLQLGLVYFGAGIAKINSDWLLAALPLRIWLPARASTPLIGGLFDSLAVAYAMSWAGMLFDLTVPLWLMWRRTRWLAYTAVLFFHTLTALLFNIGLFPWLMLACTLVFFDEQDLPWLGRLREDRPLAAEGMRRHGGVLPLLTLFLLFQLLVAGRHWLYPGPVNWTEEGFRFSWRVMLVEKTGQATFWVRDPNTEREWVVFPSQYLSPIQEKQMAFQPDMIQQFAHFLAGQYGQPVEVRAEVYVSWNGRPSRLLVDTAVNLAAEPITFLPKTWILPPAN